MSSYFSISLIKDGALKINPNIPLSQLLQIQGKSFEQCKTCPKNVPKK